MRIGFSFLVFNALIFTVSDIRLIMAFYTACAIHEAGHIAALVYTGGRLSAIEFSGAGIRMETVKRSFYSVRSSFFVLIAGPAANLLAYLLLRGYGGELPRLNLAAALYNLLPLKSLDGGALISLFTSGTACERKADILLSAIGAAFIAGIIFITR